MTTDAVYPPDPAAPPEVVAASHLTFATPAACKEFMGGIECFAGLYFLELLRVLEVTGLETLADLKKFLTFWTAIMSPGAKERFAQPDIHDEAVQHAVMLVNAFNNNRGFMLKYAKRVHAEYAAARAALTEAA